MMRKMMMAALGCAALAGCAAGPPPTAAENADAAACTQAADAAYEAQNYDELSRTSQTGVRYSATPNHVFDAQRLGSLHVRDSQITDCERNGNNDDRASLIPGPPPATPQIVTQP